ncbi:class II aldolase/adducin family protein [Marivibrio halodurans]|uniref:Class II aldolase/adducin family protein n=1 Tax=Marivibrio halodurans TaxID=2039722 RepID=A0A8J7S5C7_9PROT|nr:class II aldolase/adducin family protein [Marivibrio halodurans]MBP5857064.1 class II aldolase/adducin family protein [Marivibrio halodurans]
MTDDPARAQTVIDTARAMNASGINQGKSGNVSVRGADGTTLLITPSGVAYDDLTPGDIVPVDIASGEARGPLLPSSEWRMHRDIYRARPEAGAVVHTHSTFSTALACREESIPAFHYMVAVAGGTDIRCAPYATFGTQALSDHMIAALDGRKACLLANHGMICFEANAPKALALAVEVETLSRQYWHACQGGHPTILSDAEMAEVLEKFKSYGKQPGRGGGD